MISKCDAVTLRRKKFSDFEIANPLTKEEAEKIYLAGYMEDENGEKINVKLYSTAFINIKQGDSVGELTKNGIYNNLTILPETYDGSEVIITTVEYDPSVDFLQISKIANGMFSTINDKKYFCIKLSSDMPLGTVFRIYLPNFPLDKGVMLFPNPKTTIAKNTPVEVLYNEQDEDVEPIDFYITLIQTADEDGKPKAKVISVLNIRED